MSQITFYYSNAKNETARIVMRLYQKKAFSEWVVKLGSIPVSPVG